MSAYAVSGLTAAMSSPNTGCRASGLIWLQVSGLEGGQQQDGASTGELNQLVRQLHADLYETTVENQELTKELQAAYSALADAEKGISAKQSAEVQHLNAVVEWLYDNLDLSNAEVDELKAHNAKLELKLQVKGVAASETTLENDAQSEDDEGAVDATEVIDYLVDKVHVLQKQLSDAQSKLQEYSEQNDYLIGRASVADSKVDELSEQCSAMHREIDEVNAENYELGAQLMERPGASKLAGAGRPAPGLPAAGEALLRHRGSEAPPE